MDRPDSARTNGRPSARRPRHVAPGPPPRRPAALASQAPRHDEPPRRPPGLPVSAIVRGLPATVGGVGLAFFLVQAALGWGLGVAGAGLTVLVAVMLLAVLVVTDALGGRQEEVAGEEERYDLVVCGAVATTVAVAIACLYLPLPWGGLCAAVVLAGLVVAMRLR
jgi:hypothetical protein